MSMKLNLRHAPEKDICSPLVSRTPWLQPPQTLEGLDASMAYRDALQQQGFEEMSDEDYQVRWLAWTARVGYSRHGGTACCATCMQHPLQDRLQSAGSMCHVLLSTLPAVLGTKILLVCRNGGPTGSPASRPPCRARCDGLIGGPGWQGPLSQHAVPSPAISCMAHCKQTCNAPPVSTSAQELPCPCHVCNGQFQNRPELLSTQP